MRKALLSFWPLASGEQCLGNAALLDQPPTAFFASRQCPGSAIRAAMDWAIEQARTKNLVISGFHSPLEQSVLKVLLAAKVPCVIVAGRQLQPKRLPQPWVQALQEGNAALVSVEQTTRRLTAELAARRNEWIAHRAERIVVAHFSEGGHLHRLCETWQSKVRFIPCHDGATGNTAKTQ
jgi:predicted Rossmann fold nucleotide-binding protein DprA/Smf involved in DNA uptake